MLEKRFSLLFYLKKPKNYEKGLMPIYLRLTIDGIPKEISTARQCEPDRWNSNSGRAYGTTEQVKSLNAFLDALQTKVHNARLRLLEKDQSINSDALMNILKGKKEKSKMLLAVFQEHNNQMKSLVGKDFSPATLERYITSMRHTKSFIQWKYGLDDIDIRQLDFEFVLQYEFWLKTNRHCNHNSAIKYIANFRKIINRSIRMGWLDKDPFVGFKMTKKEVVPEYLSQHELETLNSKKFNSERLNQVRDIFVFCCYTGLAFADVKKLKTSEIGVGIDGSKWIITKRQKTDTISRIPLLPISLEIVERYKNHPVCLNSERVLPVLSNQKYNEYLKEIATLCGINKKMTTHTARHTFATTVTF